MRFRVIALTVASMLGLSGCVVVDTAPQDGTAPPHASSSASGGSAPSKTPGTKPSAPRAAGSTSRPTLPKINLSAEEGTTFLAAHRASGLLSPPKVLGPWVVQWVIDGTDVTYREIICTGTTVREATGTLEDGKTAGEDVAEFVR